MKLAALCCAAVLMVGGTAAGKGRPTRPPVKPKPQPKVEQRPVPVDQGTAPAEQRPPTAADPEADRGLKRGERVEFDGRLIEGQTAASGAIYLFERLPSELRSMVQERRGYRREILETVYPNGAPPPAPTGPERGEPAKGGK